MARYVYTIVAQAYGDGDYGSCDYNCVTTSTGTNGNTNTSTSPLADTGIAIVGVLTFACLIIFIALMVRFMGRRKRSNAAAKADRRQTPGNEKDE
jgi:hypothetical protein